jgi:serine/alanine adding enzyme
VHEAEQQLRELKVEKQLCAKRFGELKRSGGDVEPLKAEMQRITAAIQAAETQAPPAAERAPAADPADAAADFPVRFSPFTAAIDERVADQAIISLASPEDRVTWDEFVAAHPRASLYHGSAWREMIVREMRQQDVSLVAKDQSGRLLGVLPLIEMQSRLFGRFAASLPYFNYGGPLALHGLVEDRLLQVATESARARGLRHVEVRETQFRATWPARDTKVSMIRRLPASEAALDAELGSKLRAQIRRAGRESPDVRIGGSELLDDFYNVFARSMRDLGTPVYGKQFFRAVLAAALPGSSHVVVAWLGRRPVGAAILLGFRDMLEIPWASTVREANPIGTNMFMYRSILGFAIEQGYGFFDFGRSTVDAGTFRFKKQWGAHALRHHWHYGLPAGQSLPQLNPDNPKYRLMIAAWRRLPVAFTRLIGPPIVRSLP